MQTPAICELGIFIALVLLNAVDSASEGELCFHSKKGVDGICKEISQCESAIDDLKKGMYPQNCGFVGKKVIVCCPETSSVTTTTTEKSVPKPVTTTIAAVGEKSRKACKSYEHLGYNEIWDPTGFEDKLREEICPFKSGLPVIIGGKKALEGEFPHMALIGYGTPNNIAWRCGGTLLSEKFVLTAAHCLFARDLGEPKTVRLGDLNHTDPTDDKYAQQINIKTLYKHPDYKFPTNYHDIALLELEKPAEISLFVKPACLYTRDSANIQKGVITGWGVTETGELSDYLLKATVESFSHSTCNKTYSNSRRTLPRGVDADLQICFGSSDSNKDTCQGDSGGPIQKSSDVYCSYDVFGITSFGKGCGHQNLPGGYVKILPYIDWIEKIVWP